jgi:hypothetical protein
MIALKRTSARVVGLLLLQCLWLQAAHSQQPGGSAFEEETKKQEAIYRSRGENVPAGYVVDRSLLSYASTLPAGFDRSLANLGPADRWLDIGAGEGNAILDYYTELYDAMHWEGRERRGRKAQAVAISIEDRRTSEWYMTAARLEPDKIRYLHGRPLREYPAEELGRFQLITDVIGGFSYARFLSVFMEKVLSVMDVNATFYTVLLDVVPETEPDPDLYKDLRFLTEIESADGSDVKVCSWLKRITCVQVTCELNTELKRPIELYRIQKVCDKVAVPSLLPVSYEAGTPPPRRYRLEPPRPALAEELRTIEK